MNTRDKIDLANTKVPLGPMLRKLGVYVPDGIPGGGSYKIHCPWEEEHLQYAGKAMRFYPDTNTATCFAVHGLVTPCSLVARERGVSWSAAADLILKITDNPVTLRERLQAALHLQTPQVDRPTAVAWLRVFLMRNGLDPDILEVREKFTKPLLQLLPDPLTPETLQTWTDEVRHNLEEHHACS